MKDFPLKFSSVANCFVYDNLNSEMLWLHLIVRPLYKNRSVAIREVGFFASDAENVLEEDGLDTILLVYCFGLLALTVILTPLLYLVEGKLMSVRMKYGCCGKKRPCNIIQFFTDSNVDCNLLIQMIGSNGEGPIGLVRKKFSAKMGRRIIHEVHIPGKVGDIGETEKLRIMSFPTDEQAVSKGDIASFELSRLTIGNTKQSYFKFQSVHSSYTMTCMQPVEIDLLDSSSLCVGFLMGFGAILRSYLPISIIFPPNFNILLRAERLLCLVLVCVGGSAMTLFCAGFFSTLFGNAVERIFTVDSLSGFVGAAIWLPLPSLLRILSLLVAKRHQGAVLSPRKNSATLPRDVQTAMKSFLGLVEIVEASTSMPIVVNSRGRFDAIVPSGAIGKFLPRSLSCSSLRQASDLTSVTAKTSVTREGLPVRLSSSCRSLYRDCEIEATDPEMHFSEPRKSSGLYPSGVPRESGRTIVKRFYTDVLSLELTPVHPRKSAFHVIASPVMVFLIAASTAVIVAQYLQLARPVVDVASLILQSVMFTFLVSFNADLLFALILFRENR